MDLVYKNENTLKLIALVISVLFWAAYSGDRDRSF